MYCVKQTYRDRYTKVHDHAIRYKMKVGAEIIEKRPKGHKIVYEVLIVELEVLIRFLNTLRCFERLTPIE